MNWNTIILIAVPIGVLLALLFLGLSYFFLRRTHKLILNQRSKLQESEKQFRLMFEEHSAAMLLIEPKSGRILEANGAACQFYGYTGEQLKTRSIDEINDLDRNQAVIERDKALCKENNLFYAKHKLASGEIRDIEDYCTPINSAGETVLFSIIHDITERKRSEETLRLDKESLEKLLAASEQFLENSDLEVDYQKITDNLLKISGGEICRFQLV